MKETYFGNLFSPIKIGPVEIKNRIVHSCHGTESEDTNCHISDRGMAYNIERAKGGIGLILVGDVNIEGGESAGISMSKVNYIPKLRDLTDEVHFWGAKIFAHLHYTSSDPIYQLWMIELKGGQSEPIPTVAGISPEAGIIARQITISEIETIQNAFAGAAKVAMTAGFDGVSINGAHAFFPAQFINPRTNKRTDKYGGDIVGRTRFLVEIIQKIRAKTRPDFPVMLKISGDELREDGLHIEDTVEAAQHLEKAGLSAVFVVGGTQSKQDNHRTIPPIGSTPFGCFVPFAEAIKKAVKIPVAVAGRINDPQLAEDIIREGKADLIAIARASMADPEWAKKAKEGRVEDINKCIYCNRCIQSVFPIFQSRLRCTVNAAMYREREYAIKPVDKAKKVLVIGGGPGGMEAARVAAMRGHQVILCEQAPELGGQLLLAAKSPHKEEIANFTKFLVTQVRKSNVSVMLNEKVTPKKVARMKPDVVIVATGASPTIPDIPGTDKPNVVTAWEVIKGKVELKQDVAIIGGGLVGCETCELLVQQGKKVTLIEMLPEIALDVEFHIRAWLLERFKKYDNISIHTNSRVVGIDSKGVKLVDKAGATRHLPAGSIVLATGSVANDSLMRELEGTIGEVYSIGDCHRPTRILEAVHDGAYIARQI